MTFLPHDRLLNGCLLTAPGTEALQDVLRPPMQAEILRAMWGHFVSRKTDSEQRGRLAVAQDYFPLLLFVVIAIVFSFIAIGFPSLMGPGRKNKQKLEPYESGIIPFHDARRPFPIKYYLVAMLFILFDIEVLFLYPWAGIILPLRDQYGVLADA